jgi:hypothetical protein
MSSEAVYYMADLETILKRSRSTIITWERNGWLPDDCAFHRDQSNFRYWTESQVESVKVWMASMNQGRVNAGRSQHGQT